MRSKYLLPATAAMFSIAALLLAQDGEQPVTIGSQLKGRGGRGGGKKAPSAPTPRWPDGHPLLSAPPGQTGSWDSGFGSLTGKNYPNLPTHLEINDVPFQPWAKAL